MQTDAELLEDVIQSPSSAVVRIYRWDQPTVSLGYFQPPDAETDRRLAACPRVRRLTGGGAILHDQEITYSCVLPACHPIRKNPTALYDLVHNVIVDLMGESGVRAALRMNASTPADTSEGADPFLCFLRSDPRDIVCRGYKIVGSAQRRRRGHILQHGSIMLSKSALTPELPGILDLCEAFDLARFEAQLGPRIRSAISLP